jgi:hypothetical protein
MKCGERGHVTAQGLPCGQSISRKMAGCIWHSGPASSPEGRKAMAMKGGIASRMMRALPVTYHVPAFESPESIIAFARELADMALKEDVDLRRVAEARGAATLALSAFTARTQAQLVDALLSLERGSAAVALLTQFTSAQASGARTPLPGRLVSLPATTPSGGPA